MYNSPEELLRQIRLGEDTSLEFEAVRFQGDRISDPKRDDLADELAAIANTHDGVLVLGVDDKTRDVVGIAIDRLDAVERYIYEICTDTIKPPIVFRSFRVELPDATGTPRAVLKLLAKCPVDDPSGAVGRRFLMEKRGEGVPIILEESRRLSGREPEYRLIDDAELLLTIYAAREPRGESGEA